MIAELGLRYRPTAATDLAAHAEALRLLTLDVADLPPDRLERAIATWVRAERWMPKASELVGLCQRHQREEIEGRRGDPGRSPRDQAEAYCDSRNADLQSGHHPRADAADLEWYIDRNDQPALRYRRRGPFDPANPDRCSPREVDHLNWGLRCGKHPFRFDRDGYPFDLAPSEVDPTAPEQGA